MPFFSRKFFFGEQEFAGKKDEDRSDNGERHGKVFPLPKYEQTAVCTALLKRGDER